MTKLNRVLWFLQRPQYYPELFRRLVRNIQFLINPAKNIYAAEERAKTKQEATVWCESIAVNTEEALNQLTSLKTFEPFEHKFQDIMLNAQIRVEKFELKSGGGNLDLLYYLTESCQATRVIETGVAFGWSSLALLLSLQQRQDSLLISTDLPYILENSQQYLGIAVPPELRLSWKIILYPDRESLPQALKLQPEIDLAHYDSDKFYDGRMWAYPKLWDALRAGGFFISDDVEDDFGFRDFCLEIGQNPIIVKTTSPVSGNKYVGVLVKPLS